MADIQQGVTVRAKVQDREAQTGFRRLLSTTAELNQAWEFMQKVASAASAAIRSTVGASVEQERIFIRLRGTLDRVGVGYAQNEEALNRFFAAQQQVTRFGDEATAAALTQIAQLTGALEPSIDDLMDFTRTAQDLAEATGRDLSAAAQLVAQAAAGQSRSLATVLPAYRDQIREINRLSDASERGAALMAILSEEFGGAAESISPFEVAIERTGNAIGDISEAVGGFIMQSEGAQETLAGLANIFDAIAVAIDPANENVQGFGDVVNEVASQAGLAMLSVAETIIEVAGTARRIAREFEARRIERQRRQAGRAEEIFEGAQTERDIRRAARRAARAGIISQAERDEIIEARGADVSRLANQLIQDIRAGQEDLEQSAADLTDQLGEDRARVQRQIDNLVSRFRAGTGGPSELGQDADPDAEGDGDGDGGDGGRRPRGTRDAAQVGAQAGQVASEEFNAAFVQGIRDAFKTAEARELGQEITPITDEFTAAFEERFGEANLAAKIDVGTESFAELNAEIEATLLAFEGLDPVIAQMEEALAAQEAMIEAQRTLREEIGDTAEGELQDFALGTSEAFGAAAAAGESFGDTASKAALKGAGSMASSYGRLFFLQGLGFQAIPGLQGQGAALIGAGLALSVLGGALGVAAAGVGGGGGGRRGGGEADLSDNFRGASTGRDELRIDQRIFLDGEPIARNQQRHMELGGASRL